MRQRFAILAVSVAALTTVPLPQVGAQLTTENIGPAAVIGSSVVNNRDADVTANGDTQSTTSFVLGANGVIVAGFMDSGSRSGATGSPLTGWARSTDGGLTWNDMGTLPASPMGDEGNPVLARDMLTGRIFFATEMCCHPNFPTQNSGTNVYWSDDNGASFQGPVNGMPGFGDGDFLNRHWLTIDNFHGIGRGHVYLVTSNSHLDGSGSHPNGIYFTRSLDGGSTWGPNGGLALATTDSGNIGRVGPWVAIGPSHEIYVFYLHDEFGVVTLRLRKSVDLGVSFGAEITATTLVKGFNNLDLDGGFFTNTHPYAAVNPVSGAVYLVYNDATAPFGSRDKGDILFRQSIDGGATWSDPSRVNTDTTTRDQWSPTIAVTPDGSRIFISWYDRRRDAENWRIDYFGAIGTIAGDDIAWLGNFRITDESFPPAPGGVLGNYMGYYDQAVADDDFFYVTWGDNRLSNQFHQFQPDVRFARIPVAGPAVILNVVSSTARAGNGNAYIDPSECADLAVTLRNVGLAPATGIRATLTSSAGDMVISRATVTYPDIPPGGVAVNDTPFEIRTGPAFVCGLKPNFELTVTTNEGTQELRWTHDNGPGAAMQLDQNSPQFVGRGSIVESAVDVSGFSGVAQDVRVSVHLDTVAGEVSLFLVGPDNTIVQLSGQNGSIGHNYGVACSPQADRTTFDDAATVPIAAQPAPFAGSFRPDQPLSAFNGKSAAAVNGTWRLRVVNHTHPEFGASAELQCWSLFIGPVPCFGGACAADTAGDFDANGSPDLLWQHPDGAVSAWLMNGTSFSGDARSLYTRDTEWRAIGHFDMNGDGDPDLLWQHPVGALAAWMMYGTRFTGDSTSLFGGDTEWAAVGAADFNADGSADIVWQHPTGPVAVWLMNRTSYSGNATSLYTGNTEWKVVAIGDFDRDGSPDLVWQRPDGPVALWLMNGANFSGDARSVYPRDTEWHIVGAADFSRDGGPDLVWQHPDGPVAVWIMDGPNFLGDARSIATANSEWRVLTRAR